MDEKLLSKVCFNMMSMAGFIKIHCPEVYGLLFDLEYEFTKEELDTIMGFANRELDLDELFDLAKEIL